MPSLFIGYLLEIQSTVVVAVARGTSLALLSLSPLKALVGNDQIGIYAALLCSQSSPTSPALHHATATSSLGLFNCLLSTSLDEETVFYEFYELTKPEIICSINF